MLRHSTWVSLRLCKSFNKIYLCFMIFDLNLTKKISKLNFSHQKKWVALRKVINMIYFKICIYKLMGDCVIISGSKNSHSNVVAWIALVFSLNVAAQYLLRDRNQIKLLTSFHQIHHRCHSPSAPGLERTLLPRDDFAQRRSLLPKSRRLFVSICRALPECDPKEKNIFIKIFQ